MKSWELMLYGIKYELLHSQLSLLSGTRRDQEPLHVILGIVMSHPCCARTGPSFGPSKHHDYRFRP